jgi:hypothetical protein
MVDYPAWIEGMSVFCTNFLVSRMYQGCMETVLDGYNQSAGAQTASA